MIDALSSHWIATPVVELRPSFTVRRLSELMTLLYISTMWIYLLACVAVFGIIIFIINRKSRR